MAGALVGAYLNDYMSNTLLILLLLVLLTFTAYKALKKANKLHREESEAIKQKVNQIEHEIESTSLIKGKPAEELEYGTVAESVNGSNESSSSDDLIVEKIQLAFQNAAKLTGLFAVVTLINLLKGGPNDGGEPLGLDYYGTGCFALSEVTMLSIIFICSLWVRSSILNHLDSGGPVMSDISWNETSTIMFPALAIVAGLAADLFGIGGGIVKGPIMLALGVHAQVASATSACMILYTSATATVSYMVFGLLIYDNAAACLLIGFFATLAGQTTMTALFQRHNRNSYIAYSIGLVVALSAAAMTIESIFVIVKE
jgi:uncharacterized membrane protein YfcA